MTSREAQIAVVDDDAGMRDAIAGLIQSICHRPTCFTSADEFLAAPGRSGVECVILDIRMPGMSGLDLQETLNRETQPPPIIFLSSYADGAIRRRAVAGGARCVLVKPIDDMSLITCIEAALAARS